MKEKKKKLNVKETAFFKFCQSNFNVLILLVLFGHINILVAQLFFKSSNFILSLLVSIIAVFFYLLLKDELDDKKKDKAYYIILKEKKKGGFDIEKVLVPFNKSSLLSSIYASDMPMKKKVLEYLK